MLSTYCVVCINLHNWSRPYIQRDETGGMGITGGSVECLSRLGPPPRSGVLEGALLACLFVGSVANIPPDHNNVLEIQSLAWDLTCLSLSGTERSERAFVVL